MATTIREVITRFGFETDEKGAKQVEKRVDNMKRGIGSLGKALGVSLGVAGAKAFFSMGQRAERAEFNLQRLAGTDFKKLRGQFTLVQNDLNKIRAGAAEVVTEKQFDIAAANYIKIFGKGEAQFKEFRKLFEFSAKQAAITGQEVNSIFDQIQAGIQGGGFDALLELPGFDIFQKKLLEFQQQAIDPGEPGGRIALTNRLKAIMGIVEQATKDQNIALRELPGVLLEADKTAKGMEDTFQKLAKTVNSVLVPALSGLNKVVGRFNELTDIAREESTPTDAFRAIFRELTNPKERPQVVPLEPGRPESAAFPRSRRPAAANTIEINNVFEIKSSNPFEAGREVQSVFDNEVKRSIQEIVRTEDE